MKDFLLHIALKGYLNHPFPTNINGITNSLDIINLLVNEKHGMLWDYIELATYTREWQPGKYFIGFNFTTLNGNSILPTYDTKKHSYNLPDTSNIILGNITTDTNHHLHGRLKKFASHGRQVLAYNNEFHNHYAIYFPGDYREDYRLLTHFYTYLYFNDIKVEKLYKRLVRDRLHYHDEIFCIAGQIIQRLHEQSMLLSNSSSIPSNTIKTHVNQYGKSYIHGNTNLDATYFAYHIRRGDFQYEHTRITAEEVWSNTKDVLDSSRTKLLYIASDERDRSFFNIFHQQNYTIVFIEDVLNPILKELGNQKMNRNHIGMIEQIICANAHTFIGTPLSTFTGYITRLRGYYRDNRYSRTFYTMKDVKHQ